jgi:hypothetical protein
MTISTIWFRSSRNLLVLYTDFHVQQMTRTRLEWNVGLDVECRASRARERPTTCTKQNGVAGATGGQRLNNALNDGVTLV